MSALRWHLPSGLRRANVRRQLPWLLLASAVAIGLTSTAVLAGLASGGRIAPMDLLSDPAEVADIPWYIGSVSDLNLFVWAAGAGIYLLAALGLRQAQPRLSAGLAWLGAFTVLFVADDRFLLHEIVYPWLFGLRQSVALALYALVLGLLLVWHRQTLLTQPEAGLLVLALLALGSSVAVDVLGWDSTARRVAEEAAKLLGATAWSLFPAAIVVRNLRTVDDPGRRSAAPVAG